MHSSSLCSTLFCNSLARFIAFLGWKRKVILCNMRHLSLAHSAPFATDAVFYERVLRHLLQELIFFLFPTQHTPQICTPRFQSLLPQLRQGGLILTAHYGNWEWMGPWLVRLGIPLMANYTPPKNPLAHTLLRYLRGRYGNYTFPLAKHPFRMRHLLRNGSALTLLLDQDHRRSDAVPSRMLNTPLHCNPIPLRIHALFPHTPIYIAWVERNTTGELVLDAFSLPPVADPLDIYTAYHDWLGERIQQYPERWVGLTHRRFSSTNPYLYSSINPW